MKRTLLPLLLLALAAGARPADAQTVRDSVRMSLHTFRYAHADGNGFNCGGGIYATWPNVASQVLGREGRYSDYSRVATEGMYIPSGWGEETTNPQHNTVVPAGRLGHRPHFSWSWGGGSTIPASCANYGSATLLGGGWTVLNASPYRITDWYAVFNVPNGRPIALFEWEPSDGLAIAFDGSFESGFSHEVDITAPRNKRAVASYAWDFGDGETGSGATPTHAYAEEGDYAVTLTVTDDDGQQSAYPLTVTVNAAHLTVEIVSITDEGEEGDTLEVVATVANHGTEPVEDVEAPRLFTFSTRLADELNLQGSRRTGPTLTALPLPPGEPATVTRATLAPGESFEVRRQYRIDAPATYRPPGGSAYRPVEADVEADLYDVDGQTDDGEAAEVRRPCPGDGCDDVIRILPTGEELTIEVEFYNRSGPVTAAPAGRSRYQNPLGGWSVNQLVYVPGEGPTCISGCVNVEVTVTDEDGEPVEGAEVRFSAPFVTGAGVVTPEQGGGFFCDRVEEDACARFLDADPTDADGRTEAIYWFPGLVQPAQARVTAIVSHPDYVQETGDAELQLLPTRVDFGHETVALTPDDATGLATIESLRFVTEAGEQAITIGCKKMGEFLTKQSGVPMDFAFVRGAKLAVDYTCGAILDFAEDNPDGTVSNPVGEIAAAIDVSKRATELVEIYYFFTAFNLRSAGTAAITLESPGPPFLGMESDFVDALLMSMRKMTTQQLLQGRVPTMRLEIHEVSYRRLDGTGTEQVPALYFRFTTDGPGAVEHTALIQAGYTPQTWLTEDDMVTTTVGGPTNAGDTALPVGGSPRAGGAAARTAGADFVPGEVLVIDHGTAAQETAQVAAVEAGVVQLTAPLRFAHAAGAVVTRVDSVRAGVPLAPYFASRAAGVPGDAVTPLLAWGDRAPAATYTVEVATDSLFADVVEARPGLTEPEVVVGPLAAGTTHYWRVRGENLAGPGDWSETYTLRPGPPPGDALAAAPEIPEPDPFGAPVVRALWAVGATSEPGEAAPSCGAGDSSVWFRFSPLTDGRLTLSTDDSSFDVVLSAWNRDEHPLAELACDAGTVGEGGAEISFSTLVGQTYYVRVAGLDGAEGLAIVNATYSLAAVNDHLADALPLGPLPLNWDGHTYDATSEEDEETGCTGSASALWWRYVPATDGFLSLHASSPDGSPELSLWVPGAGGGHPLVRLDCVYAEEDYEVGLGAPVTVGQTYYLRLALAYDYQGTLHLFADGPAALTGDVVVDGRAGWRMLAAPEAGWTVADLAALNLVQGVPGFYPGVAPNLFTGYDGAAFTTPSGGAAALAPGRGMLWYLYDTSIDPGGPSRSVALPMTLAVAAAVPPAEVVIPLHRAGDGWNLVGNPYPFAVDPWDFWGWAEGGTLASAVGQVWDPNAGSTGSYRLATMFDAGLPPWTGVFLENRADVQGATQLRARLPAPGGPGQTVAARPTLAFELVGATAGGGALLDPAAALVLDAAAADGWDGYDALELASLGDAWVALAFGGARGDSAVWKAQEARPAAPAGPFEVPVAVRTSGADGPLTLTWPRDTLPEGWALTLTDHVAGATVDLRRSDRYTFTATEAERAAPEQAAHGRAAHERDRAERAAHGHGAGRGATAGAPGASAPGARALDGMAAPRFTLRIVPDGVVGTAPDGVPAAFALGGARPNPSRDAATLQMELPQASDVRVVVYDALGREVAVLADGERAAGRHALAVEAGRLAAGVYVVRMTAGDFVGTRRLTVVR